MSLPWQRKSPHISRGAGRRVVVNQKLSAKRIVPTLLILKSALLLAKRSALSARGTPSLIRKSKVGLRVTVPKNRGAQVVLRERAPAAPHLVTSRKMRRL